MNQERTEKAREHPRVNRGKAWFGEVVRSREPKGPGVFRLWIGHTLCHEWPIITGGDIVEPEQYGGLIPPMEWVMVEPIAYRKHPRGHSLEMARIVPLGREKARYGRRTYSLDEDPFMIHVAGHSSGCIAIDAKHWESAVRAINKAFAESSFTIGVYEEDL